MDVIRGRGNNREVVSLPCSAILKQTNRYNMKQLVAAICSAANIPHSAATAA